MKYLVTGGAGFIGSAVCRHLILKRHEEVCNLDKLTYAASLSSLESISSKPTYSFYKTDICDRSGVEAVLRHEQPDAIIHLAAESHVDRSISGPALFITTNIVGTYSLLEATLKYWDNLPSIRKESFRFLHVSTDEVYGSLTDKGYFTETTPYDPSSPYSASKAASDHLAIAWYRTYGLPVILSNSSNNYGPYQFPEKLIPLMIINALLGKLLPVYGAGKNVRDWLYVEDHASALISILQRGKVGHSYNIGSRSERTNLSVVEAICSLLDRMRPLSDGKSYRSKISFVEDRPGHDYRYAIDPTKIENDVAWKPTESFETGLEKTVLWYLNNESWWSLLRKNHYDGERLGLLSKEQKRA